MNHPTLDECCETEDYLNDDGGADDSCHDCARQGRVPTFDGDGNETGEEPCPRCDGTGIIKKGGAA